VIASSAALLRAAGRRAGSRPEELLEKASHLFLTGWPHHLGTPWVNLNVARFQARIGAELRGGKAAAPRPPRLDPDRLRVGVLANLDGTLTFTRRFFEHAPEEIDMFVFDLAGPDRPAAYLPDLVSEYHVLPRGDSAEVARRIESTRLDVVLADVYKADVYGIFDDLTTPCLVDIGSTVHFVFHPAVAFRYYALQQADYLVRGRRLFCCTSRSQLGDGMVFSAPLLFDGRGLDAEPRRPWTARNSLMVFHGKLYKASGDYLECLLHLLETDSELELVVMGRGSEEDLSRIRMLQRTAVGSRIHYEGAFRLHRNAEGEVDDPSWLRLAKYLRTARLAPDPWPLGGAYSRAEAYAAGLPVAHMGIRTDAESWGRWQPAVTADHPALNLSRTTAHSVDDYVAVCTRLLHDEVFADAVAQEQSQLLEGLCDAATFWENILSSYREWLGNEATRGR
jgi:hypothetical protein